MDNAHTDQAMPNCSNLKVENILDCLLENGLFPETTYCEMMRFPVKS